MATIPREFIDDVLARVSIADVIAPFVELKKAGNEYKACCPFHKEKTPSFTISVEKNFYHCFGCQKSGDAIQFLMDHNKLGYVEAVSDLAKQAGLRLPETASSPPQEDREPLYKLQALAATFYQQQLLSHPNANIAQTYLKKRGLNLDICQRYGIGYAPMGWDNILKHATGHHFSVDDCVNAGLVIHKQEGKTYDRFRHRIMFPLRDSRGRVIAFGGRSISSEDTPKYLNSPETPVFHKGHELYGLWEAGKQTSQGIIVVEGYMDVVALAQYGITGAVATLGTAATADHLRKCFRYNKNVYFCFDGDAAGSKAAWRACETALSLLKNDHSVRFLMLPQGDDPDTFIRKLGTQAFLAKCQHAQSLTDFFFGYLQKDLDLNQLDQKAQLANRAAPLIARIPDAILRELMYTTLSAQVVLPLHVLKNIHTQTGDHLANDPAHTTPSAPHRPQQASPWRSHPTLKIHTPMRRVVSMLVQRPSLIEHTPTLDWLAASPLAGAALLNDLLALIRERNLTSTHALLNAWPDDSWRAHLEKCAEDSHFIPPSGLETEYEGAICRLIEQNQRHTVDSLLEKARQNGLSDAEKRELQRLLTCLSHVKQAEKGA